MSSKSRVVAIAGLAGLAGVWQARRKGRDIRPVQWALANADRYLPKSMAGALQKRILKQVYEEVSRRVDPKDVSGASFLNYGYAAIEEPHTTIDLPESLEISRTGMQLYHAVASGADIPGREVLEVGCGRGGGTSFIYDAFLPSRMVGVDLAERAVEACNAEFGREKLSFMVGDAENLHFPDASFDVVLNVESSHCYPDVERFLAETYRVLRPGGMLVLADLRPADGGVEELTGFLKAAGYQIVQQEDITANVIKALELDSDRRTEYIESVVPRSAQAQALDFAGVVGTTVFQNFTDRSVLYTRFAARKA